MEVTATYNFGIFDSTNLIRKNKDFQLQRIEMKCEKCINWNKCNTGKDYWCDNYEKKLTKDDPFY